jgi:putative transposase
MPDPRFPKRKHMRRLDEIHPYIKRMIYLISVCSDGRRPILANLLVHDILVAELRAQARKSGWLVGRYVVMPDHVHFLCAPKTEAAETGLSDFIKRWKGACTARYRKLDNADRLWQREFSDYLLRKDDSLDEKWNYLRMNPVEEGLCGKPEEWPFQGEIDRFV